MTLSEFLTHLPYYLLIYTGCSFVGVGIYGLIRMAWDHWSNPGISTEMNAHEIVTDWERTSPWGKE